MVEIFLCVSSKGAKLKFYTPEIAFELVQTLLFWLDRRDNMYIQTSAYSHQNCTGGDSFSTFWLDLGAAPSPPGDFANKKKLRPKSHSLAFTIYLLTNLIICLKIKTNKAVS